MSKTYEIKKETDFTIDFIYRVEKQLIRETVDSFKDNPIFCEILNHLFKCKNYEESNCLKLTYYISRNLDEKAVNREVKQIINYIREIYDSTIVLLPRCLISLSNPTQYRIINAYEYDYEAEEKKITINIYNNTCFLKNIKEFLLTDWKQLLELSKYKDNIEHIYRGK